MRQILLTMVLALAGALVIGCTQENGSHSGSSANQGESRESTSPLQETDWNIGEYHLTSTLPNGDVMHSTINIKPDQIIEIRNVRFPNGNLRDGYMFLRIGTYTKSDTTYNITYSYESCGPVLKETVKIAPSSGRIIVTVPTLAVNFELFQNESDLPIPPPIKNALSEDLREDKSWGCSVVMNYWN